MRISRRDSSPTAPRPRLIKREHLPLGDVLQRLARISPTDVYAITLIAKDALRDAERRHRRYLPNDPVL